MTATPTSHRDELVRSLSAVHARPHGTAGVLNLIRGAKVRVAADIYVLADLVTPPQAKLDLAQHAFDEARHANLLLHRIHALGFKPFRVPLQLDRVEALLERSRARDVKRVYAERGVVSDAELMELVVTSLINEREMVSWLEAHVAVLDGDPETRTLITEILGEDRRHVAYLERWLAWFEDRFSPRAVAAASTRLAEAARQLDAAYCAALGEYFDRIAA